MNEGVALRDPLLLGGDVVTVAAAVTEALKEPHGVCVPSLISGCPPDSILHDTTIARGLPSHTLLQSVPGLNYGRSMQPHVLVPSCHLLGLLHVPWGGV